MLQRNVPFVEHHRKPSSESTDTGGVLALRILGIMGSPRIGGNTDLLLNEALKGAEEQGADTEKIMVDRLKIEPCREYYGCLKDGNCVIRDDMDAIYLQLLQSDGIILASPMFFYGLTSQVKALIDRSQALWARKYVLKQKPPNSTRRGAFIAVGATKGEKLFEGSILTVRYFFSTIGVRYSEELLVRGIDKKGEIRERPAALKDAFELGRRLARPTPG
jgi:multimeric flavodoxin WrbA